MQMLTTGALASLLREILRNVGLNETAVEVRPQQDDSLGRLAAFCSSMASILTSATGQAAAQQRLAAATEKQQAAAAGADLVLRRARALALRSCANPHCANLAGATEAALRGRRCGGCGAVRYCSEACCRADWRAHRRACRLLQAGGGQ
jgi:hypothetical protein